MNPLTSSANWRCLTTCLLLLTICGTMFPQESKSKSMQSVSLTEPEVKALSQDQTKALAAGSVAPGGCEFPTGWTARDVGKDPKTPPSHCSANCIHLMVISPSPIIANINQPVTVNFSTNNKALGGPNAVCASAGKVSWGDGSPDQDMPSHPWNACGVAAGEINFLPTNPHAPNVPLTHPYATAGQYCLSATMWGNHKYHGDGSCSYDCTVSQAVTVTVRDVPPQPNK